MHTIFVEPIIENSEQCCFLVYSNPELRYSVKHKVDDTTVDNFYK